MGRTDAWALQLPEPLPVMPENLDAIAAPQQNAGSNAQLAELLNRPAPAQPTPSAAPRAAVTQCPACKASLSGVEQKFERCLSCGKSFASAGAMNVSVGI